MANERTVVGTWHGGKRERPNRQAALCVSDCTLQSLRRACMRSDRTVICVCSLSMIAHVYSMSCEPPRRYSGYESQARGGGGVALRVRVAAPRWCTCSK